MAEYINIDKVIKSKNAKLYKMLPGFVLRYIKRIIHQDRLNEDLTALEGQNSLGRFKTFLNRQNIEIDVVGKENIPTDGRYIFVSNHPFGGLDGILFTHVVGQINSNVKFLVNDILMNLPGVEEVFLPLNKHGNNSREYFKKVEEALSSDSQILIFPAGMVSRRSKGIVRDLEWKKSFVNYAKKYKRDVIPVHIYGENSNFFYNLANIRKRLGIKANLEMFYLVDEVYKKDNETIKIAFGKPISYSEINSTKKPQEWAEYFKTISYNLSHK